MILADKLTLSEEDLKELFSLFTSSTVYEREQMYDPQSGHYLFEVELSEEYSLNEEKREYALDAWRAVMYFLYRKGYSLCKDNKIIDLSFSEEEFIA